MLSPDSGSRYPAYPTIIASSATKTTTPTMMATKKDRAIASKAGPAGRVPSQVYRNVHS
jgi:hypothetical protein